MDGASKDKSLAVLADIFKIYAECGMRGRVVQLGRTEAWAFHRLPWLMNCAYFIHRRGAINVTVVVTSRSKSYSDEGRRELFIFKMYSLVF
jgi:hypothetical protein